MNPVYIGPVSEAFEKGEIAKEFRSKTNNRWGAYVRSWNENGTVVCACCGTEATHMVLFEEPNGERASLGFAHKNNTGYIRYDIDHILPRSLLGSNSALNLQITCRTCNLSKGNIPSEDEELHILKNMTRIIKLDKNVKNSPTFPRKVQNLNSWVERMKMKYNFNVSKRGALVYAEI